MKDTYRKNKNDKTVKYDSNPENDYSDGYNAGRRYIPPKRAVWVVTVLLIAALCLLALLLYVSVSKNPQGSLESSPQVTSSATPAQSVGLPSVGGE